MSEVITAEARLVDEVVPHQAPAFLDAGRPAFQPLLETVTSRGAMYLHGEVTR
ncbi:hypothetical protein [Actinomadura montaniterrae]|uniref:hypothetical protein n=1 Tax=Actinomadura montaniterrae TaxID=1803903 RepID=UPI00178C5E2E|nr:hypothetical protein [Actinomadura montaniterrae]